jgi:hypothetical protein
VGVISERDIEATLFRTVPSHFSKLRSWLFDYANGLFNHSKLTPYLEKLPSTYNQFLMLPEELYPSLLAFDPRLTYYSQYDIRGLVALALAGDGPAFFSQYFAHFFDGYELHYCDSQENLFEVLAYKSHTDEGYYTDEGQFTDSGSGGEGVVCLHAKVTFDITQLDAVRAKWQDTIDLLGLFKPVRLFVFHVPALVIRMNMLDPESPEFDPLLTSGMDKYFDNVLWQLPSGKLQTDAVPVLLTDGSPPINTDSVTTDQFLSSLTVLNVRYASTPGVLNTLVSEVRVAKLKNGNWLYWSQAEVGAELIYVQISGAVNLFSADIVRPTYVKPFNSDGNMRLRFLWEVADGVGEMS